LVFILSLSGMVYPNVDSGSAPSNIRLPEPRRLALIEAAVRSANSDRCAGAAAGA
jgi:hypothetical protein